MFLANLSPRAVISRLCEILHAALNYSPAKIFLSHQIETYDISSDDALDVLKIRLSAKVVA